MKNIHILPTDKPSRLWINNLLQGKLELSKEMLIGNNTAQNIYITSNDNNNITDEGVQHIAGTWVLDTINNKVFKASVNIISDDDIQSIILTTDQDLIKDGVQAIDDEFLEWFVNNPSCEEIEVEIDYSKSVMNYSYKIIIPKEEPNPFELPKALPDDVFYESLEEPKQENTLEEAAEKYGNSIGNKNGTAQFDFIRGAKWMQERMYSDMQEYAEFCIRCYEKGMPCIIAKDWFEQFKKK